MKLLKNKAFVGVLCLVIAALISFLLVPRFFAQQKATALVPRASKEIKAGTVITESMLTQVETGSYGLSEHILRDKGSIVGRVAAEAVHDGEFFWESSLMDADTYAGLAEAKSMGLEKGLCLVTIRFPSASAGVAGILRSACIVDVFSCTESTEEEEENSYVTVKALDNMYVYDVLNSDLVSLDKVDETAQNAAEGDSTNYNYEPAYVVIRCTESQAKTLISLEHSGALHLTLQKTEA